MTTYRACVSSYLVLCGPWFIPLALLGAAAIRSGQLIVSGVASGMVCALIPPFIFAVWLNGFCIIINKELLSYRDGLYRKKSIRLDAIHSIKNVWIRWPYLPAVAQVPRLVIHYGNTSDTLIINAKPFPLHCLKHLSELTPNGK